MGIGARRVECKNEAVGVVEHDQTLTNLADPKYSLVDLVLPETTESSIMDFLAYRKHEQLIFEDWGLSKTHRHQRQTAINFYGHPGTGKTMAAHAIASELKQKLIMVDYAQLESKYVGETSKNIAQIFKQAKEHNAIIFFDEADAILSRRVTNMSNSTDVSVNQTRSVLLTLMNDHEGLIIFTTNFIENYDPAFMRRILAHIQFNLPDFVAREKLWRLYLPAKLPHDVNLSNLAAISDSLSGSDISNCVLKAAMSAARKSKSMVGLEDFKQSIQEVMASKSANTGVKSSPEEVVIEKRVVSESYVASQIGNKALEDLKA